MALRGNTCCTLVLGASVLALCGCSGSRPVTSLSRPRAFEAIPDKELDTPKKRWVAKAGEDCFYLSDRLGSVGDGMFDGGARANQGAYERAATADARVVASVLGEVRALNVPPSLQATAKRLDRQLLGLGGAYRAIVRRARGGRLPDSPDAEVLVFVRPSHRLSDACQELPTLEDVNPPIRKVILTPAISTPAPIKTPPARQTP